MTREKGKARVLRSTIFEEREVDGRGPWVGGAAEQRKIRCGLLEALGREHSKRVANRVNVTRTKPSFHCSSVKTVTGHLGGVRLSGVVGTKTMLERTEVCCYCL